MNKKILAILAASLLVVVGCVTAPAVIKNTQTAVPEKTAAKLPDPTVAAVKPTEVPTGAQTETVDSCSIYLNTLTQITAKFDAGLLKTRGDIQNKDWNSLSWDKSQILDFANDDLSALTPPPQFAAYQAAFINEIGVYQKAATAHLQADHSTGASLFLEGDALDATRKGTAMPTCK